MIANSLFLSSISAQHELNRVQSVLCNIVLSGNGEEAAAAYGALARAIETEIAIHKRECAKASADYAYLNSATASKDDSFPILEDAQR